MEVLDRAGAVAGVLILIDRGGGLFGSNVLGKNTRDMVNKAWRTVADFNQAIGSIATVWPKAFDFLAKKSPRPELTQTVNTLALGLADQLFNNPTATSQQREADLQGMLLLPLMMDETNRIK